MNAIQFSRSKAFPLPWSGFFLCIDTTKPLCQLPMARLLAIFECNNITWTRGDSLQLSFLVDNTSVATRIQKSRSGIYSVRKQHCRWVKSIRKKPLFLFIFCRATWLGSLADSFKDKIHLFRHVMDQGHLLFFVPIVRWRGHGLSLHLEHFILAVPSPR